MVLIVSIYVTANSHVLNGIFQDGSYYGGWVAPRIFFMGFAGVIWFGNIRIGGLSGIFKSRNYYSGTTTFPWSHEIYLLQVILQFHILFLFLVVSTCLPLSSDIMGRFNVPIMSIYNSDFVEYCFVHNY
jgi:hypothetical protein